MTKRVSHLIVAGAIGLGGATAAFVAVPAVASAATTDTTATEAVSERVTEIRDALAGLVDDGSITDAQADEVATTLADQLPDDELRGFGGPGGHGFGGPGFGGLPAPGFGGPGFGLPLGTAADLLGVTDDELVTALQGGQSLAEVAADNGVDTDTLVDGLVAEAVERLDQAVAAGELTQAEADELEADLTEHITEHVERTGGFKHGDHPEPPFDLAPSDGSTTEESDAPAGTVLGSAA